MVNIMNISVSIPTILRSLTDNKKKITVSNTSGVMTVYELIETLDKEYPGIKERICENDKVRGFMNVYVNEDDIRFEDGLHTKIENSGNVMILPAVAGG